MRQRPFFVLLILIVLMGTIETQTIIAQEAPDGATLYNLNLRAGPGKDFAVIITLPTQTGMYFEARNGDMSWLLGHTADNAYRGWVASLYLNYRNGFNAQTLPVSTEVIGPSPATTVPSESSGQTNVTWSPSHIPSRTVRIFQHGQQLGNRPDAFIKIGDSVTEGEFFLEAFAAGRYALGPYSYLQETIDFFNRTGSFAGGHQTSAAGYTSGSLLDPTWGNPEVCAAGTTPLQCEYNIKKPSVAFIYFAGNDMLVSTEDQFAVHMEQLVIALTDLGVIPVLTTFAVAPDGDPDALFTYTEALPYERVIRTLAAQYQVPLIDFQQASMGLPAWGTLSDGYHLTFRNDWFVSFSGDESYFGVTLRELMSLQMLHDLRVHVIQAGP